MGIKKSIKQQNSKQKRHIAPKSKEFRSWILRKVIGNGKNSSLNIWILDDPKIWGTHLNQREVVMRAHTVVRWNAIWQCIWKSFYDVHHSYLKLLEIKNLLTTVMCICVFGLTVSSSSAKCNSTASIPTLNDSHENSWSPPFQCIDKHYTLNTCK